MIVELTQQNGKKLIVDTAAITVDEGNGDSASVTILGTNRTINLSETYTAMRELMQPDLLTKEIQRLRAIIAEKETALARLGSA